MRFHKNFTAEFMSILLVLVAVLVAGCGGTGTSNTLQKTDRIGLLGPDISTFDPGIVADAGSEEVVNAVFTGLVSLNDNQEVQPQLAASLPTISNDGLTYTFTLKPNLHFSDGTALTAHDVAYSIDRALSPAESNQNPVTLTYLGLIKDATARAGGNITTLIGDSLKVVDNNTIKIIMTQKCAYFLEALTYPTSFVVEKSVIDKWGNKWTDHLSDNGGQGGDGPFKVKEYSHTTGIKFIPNPNYYGSKPQLKEID